MEEYLQLVDLTDRFVKQEVEQFVTSFQLKFEQIENSFAIYNQQGRIIGSASIYFNLIKCICVDPQYQSANLTRRLVTAATDLIYQHGYNEVFILTKAETAFAFSDLGFKVLFHNEKISFLTNRPILFQKYLEYLTHTANAPTQSAAVLVMNCNPFTLGHLHLVTYAAQRYARVYIIMVKTDLSLFPYAVRKHLVEAGVAHLNNVQVLEGSDYLISRAIFPSYFLPSDDDVIYQQANLDANMFATYFAPALHATVRVVGEEPKSHTTAIYNQVMREVLTNHQLTLEVIPRLLVHGEPVSASSVRAMLYSNQLDQLTDLVPASTLSYLVDPKTQTWLQSLKNQKHLFIKTN